MNEKVMSALITYINQIVLLNPEEQIKVDSSFETVLLGKNELWVKEGQYCHHIAFVNRGKLRVFYHDESGSDVTCFFVVDNSFISSYTSFLTRTPTTESISAIEETELQTISRDELERLSIEVPKLQVMRRVIAENLFIIMEKRVAELQSHSAYERYRTMMEENPNILLSVPLQYSASFLGITPQHLSRLRKQRKE